MGIKAKEASPMFADKLCSLSDEDLVNQYCNTRSQRVFREIYRRYKDALFRYCAQMAPRQCSQLMENFWGAFLQAPPNLGGCRLKNWLFISINRQLQNPDAVPEEARTENDSLRSALENTEVLRAIQQLPRRERNVFLLFTECGLSLATVADIEKLPLALCRHVLNQSRQMVELTVHGSARKPWKSAATLAKEAAALAAAQQEAAKQAAAKQAAESATIPKKPSLAFRWKKAPNIAAASVATTEPSVEVV
ncbi:RNA polymerase sigma factor [Microbulbifer pacificus]|uniref:Sigma-70 family RNA polymerase sigma factor n=1 Tax=Microbulbifer pacificus TaxID=407164 RepID=A0AAU0MZF2_9GAMM|nr:sigma-70 family RNA polymerase sigma factor [Microbulbifer pacificus]WOX05204.1 sigma-70 family RNA polymerase sigma factor [Microbulbifer pacificus]